MHFEICLRQTSIQRYISMVNFMVEMMTKMVTNPDDDGCLIMIRTPPFKSRNGQGSTLGQIKKRSSGLKTREAEINLFTKKKSSFAWTFQNFLAHCHVIGYGRGIAYWVIRFDEKMLIEVIEIIKLQFQDSGFIYYMYLFVI